MLGKKRRGSPAEDPERRQRLRRFAEEAPISKGDFVSAKAMGQNVTIRGVVITGDRHGSLTVKRAINGIEYMCLQLLARKLDPEIDLEAHEVKFYNLHRKNAPE